MASNATGNAEIQVNTTSADQMFSPSITLLPAGGWIAVWTASSEEEGNEFVHTMMQRFDAEGNRVGDEVQVGDPKAGYNSPTVVPLADGGWLVMHDRGDIVQQRFDADGNVVGGETQINTVSGDLRSVSATVLEDGSWVVAWQRGAGNEDVFQQKFNVDGIAVGGEVRVNTTTSGRQFMDDIAALADGGWVVTFESPDGNSDGIFQQRYNADGVKVGSQTRVNTTTSGSQQSSTVTALADGGWVVTWSGPDGDQDGIFQQRYGSNGAKVGSETLINTARASFQTDPVVAALSDGDWVIVWRSGAQDGDGTGIYMQRIAANGAAVGTETLVNVTTAGIQSDVSVTALDGGGWVVTWKSEDPDTFVDTVQQRVFADDIRGADGDDVIEGTVFGEAILGLGGDDTIDGLAGDDTIEGGAGADDMDGGAGVDTLSYAGSTQGVTVRLSDGTASGGDADGDTFANFENVTGSEAGDTLVGSAGANVLRGGAGSDTLIGGGGADVLEGGDGADNMDGGAGIDTLSYAGSNLGVTVRLSDGTATGGVANGDTFTNMENVTGSAHNDTLEGTTGANVLVGGDGNDTLIGRGGADRLEGGNGNDTFRSRPNDFADA
ncbi:hypothetical protein LXM94_25135, partial [Rhizobium sp. TRM95111]|uniref:calcium-binding protein n=1 Tax=Rhizobium alarense TaxID=2846851 RepID=UPI0022A8B497